MEASIDTCLAPSLLPKALLKRGHQWQSREWKDGKVTGCLTTG